MPNTASEPLPSCQNQVARPDHRGKADQVEDDGLERQQDGSEGPHQQQERDERDQGDDVGKLVVDRVPVVDDGRAQTGGPDVARERPGGGRHRVDDLDGARVHRLVVWDDVDGRTPVGAGA